MDRRAFEPARVVLGRARTVYIARGLARHGTAPRHGRAWAVLPSWPTIDEHGVWHRLAADGRDGVTCQRALP